ncbi:hypothetical protein ACWPKO_20955 (plasmid) [Coraliomargarita sp. W4R53]
MTRTDPPTATPLGAPYRGIRPVRGGDDAPFSGMLTKTPTDDTCVLVAAELLPPKWQGWDAAPDSHLLAPLAVVRRTDGHDVALSVCTERLEDFLGRRERVRAPLSPGECVTVAISVLRGMSEVSNRDATVGEWWLTESGQPVLATDVGNDQALERSIVLLRKVSEFCAEADPWAEVIALMGNVHMRPRDLSLLEERLFAYAEPCSLATTALGGARSARGLAVGTHQQFDEILAPEPRGIAQRLARQVDADLADSFSQITTAVWRRFKQKRPGGKAPWFVAAAAAVVVVAIGLLWPGGGDKPATAETPRATLLREMREPTPDATATTQNSDALTTDADLAIVVDSLLGRRAECGDDLECVAQLLVNDSVRMPAGAIDAVAGQREVTFLDNFGGIAVLRVDARSAATPQMVVVEHRNDEWLLRDVYDVTQ